MQPECSWCAVKNRNKNSKTRFFLSIFDRFFFEMVKNQEKNSSGPNLSTKEEPQETRKNHRGLITARTLVSVLQCARVSFCVRSLRCAHRTQSRASRGESRRSVGVGRALEATKVAATLCAAQAQLSHCCTRRSQVCAHCCTRKRRSLQGRYKGA